MPQPEDNRLQELARFLRGRREGLRPEEAGLPVQRRRRTKGLRRDEVAAAAGISAAWYTRLEQGRDVRASIHSLERIATALRLDRAERTYLLELGRPDLDWKERIGGDVAPSAQLLALMNGLDPNPAYVLSKYWQVKACNGAARLLFGDIDNREKWGGNLIARLFCDPCMQTVFADWSSVARSAVAQLRMSTAAMANDVPLNRMIDRLRKASDQFEAYWLMSGIEEAPLRQKTLRHPLAGSMTFTFASLRPGGEDAGFTLSLHTPVDRRTRKSLELLVEKAARGASTGA
jgi:transcriptional regulator with XRE-family HTH domain